MIDLSKLESRKEYRVTYKHKNGNTYTANLLGISIKLLVQNGSIVDILKIEEAPKIPKPTPKPKSKPVFRKPKPKVKLVESPKKKKITPAPKPKPKDRMIQRAETNLKKPIPEPKPIPKRVEPPKPEPKPLPAPKPTTEKKFDLKKLALGVLGLIIAFKLLKR